MASNRLFGYQLKQLTSPSFEPIDLENARSQCRVESDENHYDSELSELITVAREDVESQTMLVLCRRTFRIKLDRFPDLCKDGRETIFLPGTPIATIESIQYFDAGGAEITLDSEKYSLVADDDQAPGFVEPVFGESWPATQNRAAAVTIDFTAGFETMADVPAKAKHAVRMLVSHWFKNKEETAERRLTENPVGAQRLIDLLQVADNFVTYGVGKPRG